LLSINDGDRQAGVARPLYFDDIVGKITSARNSACALRDGFKSEADKAKATAIADQLEYLLIGSAMVVVDVLALAPTGSASIASVVTGGVIAGVGTSMLALP
jgi:hypothetical protein